MALCVQYGCGLSCPQGWQNFDVSPTLLIERMPILGHAIRLSGKALFPKDVLYGNIVTGLPVDDDCVDYAYCSHILEHLDRYSVELALKNTFDMLKSGGVFRLVVPDLTWRAQKFNQSQKQKIPLAADEFLSSCYLGETMPSSGLMAKVRLLFGNSMHRWMYDYNLMSLLLSQAGFVNIRRCEFGDAKDQVFKIVEEEDRFIDVSGNAELAIEAMKI